MAKIAKMEVQTAVRREAYLMPNIVHGKLEAEIQIDAPAEKFYKVWKSESFLLPTASPSNIQGVEVHEGDSKTGGSIRIWKYTVEGRAGTFKERVVADDEHMSLTFHSLEGDIFKDFTFWKPIINVVPKEIGLGSIVKLSIEYEKRNKDVPDPKAYMNFLASMCTDVAAHLMKP